MSIDRCKSGTEPLGHGIENVGTWHGADFPAIAEAALKEMSSRGARVPAGNRLELAAAKLDQVRRLNVQYGASDPEMEEVVVEASRTIFEQWLIVQLLGDALRPLHRQVTAMLGGPCVPRDSHHDPARDNQAELFGAAILHASGYIVEFGEPDLLLSVAQAERIGVAVKRLVSESNVQNQLSKARRQLRSNGVRGFIMVNAERLLSRQYWQRRDADLGVELSSRAAAWRDLCDRRDAEYCVLGVIAMATVFRYQITERCFEGRFIYNVQLTVPSAEDREVLAPGVRAMIDDMTSVMSGIVDRAPKAR